jgi:hypothetical protein
MLEDESHHSKWEEFRRLAKIGSDHDECSQLLRRMELQDSKEEDELGELGQETQMTLEDANMGTAEEFEAKRYEERIYKKQKRKNTWGPIQRMPRPRRYPEDGKTVMQRAQELKAFKNLSQGTKHSSFAFESNTSLNNKAVSVNISLGDDNSMINHNIDMLKQKELQSGVTFVDKNPEINLPTDLCGIKFG